MRKYYLTMIATALLVVGLTACTPSNPLNIVVPAWEQFAHPKSDGVKLYMSADEHSPKLQIAQEPCEGDACDIQIIWAGEWVPRDWTVNDWDVSAYDAFPILAEEGDFYKVYVSSGWLGAAEAYVKKSDCNVVKPVEITQEVLDSIGVKYYRRDYVVQKGELKNLCLSSSLEEYDEVVFNMGQLYDNCLVFVNAKPIWLNQSDEDAGIKIVPGEDNEVDKLEFGKDDYWVPNEESPWLFDTKKLSDELVNELFNMLRPDSVELTEVLYYLPDVDKDRLISYNLSGEVKKALKADAEEDAHPFFGNILKVYGEKLEERKDYRQIGQEMTEMLNRSRGREIPVIGSPYGIKTSKAVISDWNIQSFGLNLILEFIPDEGTDFSTVTNDYVRHLIYCYAMADYGCIYKRAAHVNRNSPSLYVTLNINSKDVNRYESEWNGLKYLTLTDNK